MKKSILISGALLLLSGIPVLGEELDMSWYDEEVIVAPSTKLEKAEASIEHMKERVDFYQRVVRSVEHEEQELKELRKLRVRNTSKVKK